MLSGGAYYPFSLDVKAGEMKGITEYFHQFQRGRNEGYYRVLPSMPKEDIFGNMEDGIIGIDVNIYTICDIW